MVDLRMATILVVALKTFFRVLSSLVAIRDSQRPELVRGHNSQAARELSVPVAS
jgi:hypothetical protein